ncbi:unnamed protein product [Lymnaea stagnalis]|uniref:CUE domain-containing protein n=1 Tax=Lymnaea stagnalis TaxID=6523 RepID=A0AAV2IAT7_LYMST
MRQLEFNQAMSDFRHMFPETDEEVIEAVLRANNGMVDATIDQLLTMNIDAEINEDDDLPDHILLSVEKDKSSKDTEDCPPSYTEAVQSHLAQHHRSSNTRIRHRNSPTMAINNNNGLHSRHSLSTMQHLLDLGPDTAPLASSGVTGPGSTGVTSKSHHSHHHSIHHHSYHHNVPRSSNHHRRRGDALDGSPHKPRPGRNLLASSSIASHQDLVTEDFSFRPQRKGSLDSNDFTMDNGQGLGREKSPHRWRSSPRDVSLNFFSFLNYYLDPSTSVKRPVYRNWNPPLLGTLPDDFLRITKVPTVPQRPVKSGKSPTCLQRSSLVLVHYRLSGLQRKYPSRLPATHEFSSDILQERMKENERRRRMTSVDVDPDLTQYLEDERLAIMLQNSEFLQELRGDRIFMMTLERGKNFTLIFCWYLLITHMVILLYNGGS